jgi:hypothetical protein
MCMLECVKVKRFNAIEDYKSDMRLLSVNLQ